MDKPGLAPVPSIAVVPGHPAGSRAVLESALEPRRHQGVPAHPSP